MRPEAAGRPHDTDERPVRRSPMVRGLLAAMLLFFFILFVSLGTWQVQRRAWKLDLIARVENRINAPIVAAPDATQWASIDRDRHEYLPVRLRGTFRHDLETLVQASTVVGAGFWVLTPLQTPEGGIVFVNRGFVPPEYRKPGNRRIDRPQGLVEVNGLLRMPEPGGGFLRENDPAADRWYSRDVSAIARARHLETGQIAPYFVDQTLPVQPLSTPDAPVDDTVRWHPPPDGHDELALANWMATQRKQLPLPGLTVVSFSNNHLSYIFTWYSLALLVAFAAWKMFLAPSRGDGVAARGNEDPE